MKALIRAFMALAMAAGLLATGVVLQAPSAFADDGPSTEEVNGGAVIDGDRERTTDAGAAQKPIGDPVIDTPETNPPDCRNSYTVWFWEASRDSTKQVDVDCQTVVSYPTFGPRTTGMSVEYTSQYGIWPGMNQCPNPMPQDGFNPPFGSTWTIGVKVNVEAWWEQSGSRQEETKPAVPPDPGTPDLDPTDPNYRPPTPGQPAEWRTLYNYTGITKQSMTCYSYTAPEPRTVQCVQAGTSQIMGPYDTNGDAMVPLSEGGTLTRRPPGVGEVSVEGAKVPGSSTLGDAMRKQGQNPFTRPATKALTEQYCLAANPLIVKLENQELVTNWGRYYVNQDFDYTNATFLDFTSWGNNPTVLAKLWPKYYGKDSWFSSSGYYPHFIESVEFAERRFKRFYQLRCEWVEESGKPKRQQIYFVRNIESGTGWQGANWAPFERELGDQTYLGACGDPDKFVPVDEDCPEDGSGPCDSSTQSRERDVMRCEPSTGDEFIVNAKRAAPIEFATADRFNSNDVFEANATGTPYGVRWETPKVVLNSNGKDVTTLPDADVVWRTRYDLTPGSSPVLIRDPRTGETINDVNNRNQPYNLWADRTPEDMNAPPTASTQWFPLTWSGTPMSVPLDEWSEREDDGWQDETRALWLRFFQSTTAGKWGWQLTPEWEITANVPVTGEIPVFGEFTARGFWIPQYGGTSTEIRRVAYVCTGERLNVNITRSVDLFR